MGASRRMHDPLDVTGQGVAVSAGGVRLPPGERFQVIHFSAGTIAYTYGQLQSPVLYPATVGASPIMVHPGTDTFINLFQAVGTVARIHVVGSIPDDYTEQGWDE